MRDKIFVGAYDKDKGEVRYIIISVYRRHLSNKM